jgi:hypothetical protein
MDDKTNSGNPDRSRINLSENYEVEYWAKKFNVTPEELKAAVKEAGSTADKVEAYLKRN